MNDFQHESDVPGRESGRNCAACGLLPREDFQAGATLTVRDGFEGCETDRLYQAVPVRIDGTETTLLAGTWCEFEARTAYRVTKASADGHRRERRLVTVELVER